VEDPREEFVFAALRAELEWGFAPRLFAERDAARRIAALLAAERVVMGCAGLTARGLAGFCVLLEPEPSVANKPLAPRQTPVKRTSSSSMVLLLEKLNSLLSIL
jgi:hypothetical protein